MVYQWLSGLKPVAPAKCVTIEQFTQGKVTRKDLRPNDWSEIWPELVVTDKTAPLVSNHRHISERRANRRKPRITP